MTSSRADVAIVCVAPLRDRATCGGNYSIVLAEALAASGARAELWCDITGYERAPAAIPLVPVWRPGLRGWFDVARAYAVRRPSIVHLQHYAFLFGRGAVGEIATIGLLATLALMRARIVVTLHDVPGPEMITADYVRTNHYGYPAPMIRAGIRALFGAIGTCARAVIVHEDRLADRARRFGVTGSKLRVIPHMGVPARPLDRADALREIGFAGDEPLVLFFGFANPYKGIENLIAAFAILARRGSRVRLALGAGERPKAPEAPEYRAYYADLRRAAEAAGNVTFVGYIPGERLDAYIRASDLGIIPYVHSHGASGPLHHFLAHEHPVIVSTQVAEFATELADVAFDTAPTSIADAIEAYFAGETSERVGLACTRMLETLSAGKFVALTEAVYAEARAR